MPIPETPYTREEAYLNAIATGDSGSIPETPYTREEMYLDYIARNGGGGGGGSSTLSGLTDVDISNPTDGQTLVYNATSGKWVNGSSGGGGGGLVVPLGEIGGNPTLMAPAGDIFTAYMSGVDVVITLNIDGYGLVEAKRLSVVGVDVEGSGTKIFVIESSSTYSGIIPSGVYEAGSDADYPSIPR